MTNREKFIESYTRNLALAVQKYPEEYAWPISEVPKVVTKMVASIDRNGYNKDSRAIKATCRELNIKHTYTAIREYWVA